MPTFAPGFINVHSPQLGGEVSISIARIIGISPTIARRGEPVQCTLYMDSGETIVVDIPRDDVLQAISEAAGADRAGSGAAIDRIAAGVKANTQALVAAMRTNRQTTFSE